MSDARPFLLGVATATVTLGVGLFVGGLLADAPSSGASASAVDVSPQLDALTRAIDELSRQARVPLRAAASNDTTADVERAAPDPRPLDVGPSREDLAAQVASLRARIAELEARGSVGTSFRPDGVDGSPAPRIAMQRDAIEELLALGNDELLGEVLLLTQRQVYERLGGPARISKKDDGLSWSYTPDPSIPNRYLVVIFNDGVVTSFFARR